MAEEEKVVRFPQPLLLICNGCDKGRFLIYSDHSMVCVDCGERTRLDEFAEKEE